LNRSYSLIKKAALQWKAAFFVLLKKQRLLNLFAQRESVLFNHADVHFFDVFSAVKKRTLPELYQSIPASDLDLDASFLS